ncbi:hypothetical protein RJ639_004296 [Escallonia herrerae]|uniref:Uncharacterized protein n=1 Tax=Escallonia herrerae TaxID=1293975 RepID=A0AA89B154_9ASTE|nr:hypothetical protein RJ639_004296 [Escallonia herrerae]
MSTLLSLSSSDGVLPLHLYTYNYVMDGFSAALSRSHLEQLERTPGHVATYEETFGQIHTTHTPKFLGLNKRVGLWPVSSFGDDMIIGIIDTGIWPESDSFNDAGMPAVPSRWCGTCESGTDFNSSNCNRKLIGALSFSQGIRQEGSYINKTDDYDSPRDYEGHGTHTSSTAAGNVVPYTNYFGSDTLAGMDQAIEDGVDLMSLSLGFIETLFFNNPIALRAFAAMEKGIFVSCSAGNAGPHPYTMLNGAPWITTVEAGSIDRDFAAHVTVSDGSVSFTGKSIYPENLLVERVPIYFGHGNESKEARDNFSLDPKDVEGKYVFCVQSDYPDPSEIYRAGALGAIISSDGGQFLRPYDFPVPYVVAYFSSRGPDRRDPWILKPDLLAPGLDILAAWAPNREGAPIREDESLLTDYKIISGTSMASPHIIGIAALLKSAYPDRSSAAIRSAMMTTAFVLDNTHSRILDMNSGAAATPLDFGAGHVNPNKAMDPGLVYDIGVNDYINHLCAMNYTRAEIKIITRRSDFSCDQASLDLNYPSFMLILNNTNTTSYTFKRVLTNVVDSSCAYRAMVKAPSTMKVVVEPETIYFTKKCSRAEFNMTVEIDLSHNPWNDYFGNSGYLSWYEVNGTHIVRSPIVSAYAP